MDWDLNKNIVVFILVTMVTNICLCTGNHGNQRKIHDCIVVIKCTVKGLSRNVINNYIFLYYMYYYLKKMPIFMIIIHVNIKSWVQSLQLYIDRYIDLYVCKYMIYHCIHWWTVALHELRFHQYALNSNFH